MEQEAPQSIIAYGRYHVLPGPPACVVRRNRPDVRVFVERGLVVQEKDRARYPERTIFLDGVYAGPPLLDNTRKHYSLDHHAGVIRAFTVATCEQAAVLISSGLPIDTGSWQIYVNEPDLDAALASWVLLNHDRLLADGQRLLWDVMPIIRVEGVIDTHGLDMGVVSGVRPRVYAAHKERLDELRARELELKQSGRWERIDPRSYTAELLDLLDRRLMQQDAIPPPPASEPSSLRRVEWPARRLAVLFKGERPIYELERDLKGVYGRELALIVLDRGAGRMTLLQVDPFLPKCLNDLYPLLNQRDGKANESSGNVWGGSADIGGSPRASGTSLSGDEVLQLAAQVFACEPSA
jgi:hypothetical protein